MFFCDDDLSSHLREGGREEGITITPSEPHLTFIVVVHFQRAQTSVVLPHFKSGQRSLDKGETF